ncbi:MAG: hypothetical protein P8I74_09010 [Phycisphaerales bacterium]|nr:hypothetical protein [Phycisphaerales bacterium]
MTINPTTPRTAGSRSFDRMTVATELIVDLHESSQKNSEVVRPPPIHPN